MLIVISLIVGEDVRVYSTMFQLGNEGLSTALLLQFLGVSFMITGLQYIFFTDKLIKKGSSGKRTALMLTSIIIGMSFFIHFFHWFPMNSILPWLMFFAFFFGSFAISVGIVYWKEKLENKQMREGLALLKAQLKEESHDK